MSCWDTEDGKLFDVSVCHVAFFFFFSKRSTFSGTELDFLLKLTRQTKNNPPLKRERQNDEGMKERREVRENGWVKK